MNALILLFDSQAEALLDQQISFQSYDFILAADSGYALGDLFGLPISHWVGDGDSTPENKLKEFKEKGVLIKLLSRNKDYSDTEEAIKLALDLGALSISFLGGGGGRLDHILILVYLAKKYAQVHHWITSTEEIFVSDFFQFSFPLETTLSIFPTSDFAKMKSKGLEWPLENWDFTQGGSLSNRASAEKVEIECDSGRFLVVRPFLQRKLLLCL